jgi:Zn-dependent protease with chaperone function
MHDLIEFFAQCARSGTLLTSLCAVVLLPIGAWLSCRCVAPAVVLMKDAAAWQAPLAAATAALPGALFVVLSIGALFGGIGSACLALPAGRLVFGLLIATMIGALARAVWLAMSRAIGVRRLVASSSDPSPRLRAIASAVDVRARELPESAPICALAGMTSPVVLVSAGALAAITDAELRAALEHERAHARRGDQLLAAALTFLVDLLPLPAADLIATYRTARELAADEDAARATDADSLAGALIEFARGGRAVAGVACLIDDRASTTTRRLKALLAQGLPTALAGNRVRGVALALALATIATAGVVTPSVASHYAAPCSLPMKADQ